MQDDPLIDTVVNGRYRVVRTLGEGGMSLVYEVEHVKLKRQFALKRLLPQLMNHEEARIRFEREAELLASLRHPNVVDITDWDVMPDGSPFMVLEFLHGAHIRVRLDRAPLAWDAIARFGDQAMGALSLAHRNGITHRDLKPENMFISIDDAGEERVKLLDFGVSKMRGLGRTTGQHALLGTPSYMSPEQAQGLTDLIGESTDVWAMGTILYEMATQRVAFTGESLAATVINITSGRPDPIVAFRPDAPPAFIDLVDRATSTDPERRITTIDDLRARLRAALDPRTLVRATPNAGSPVVVSKTPTSGLPAITKPITLQPGSKPITLEPGTKSTSLDTGRTSSSLIEPAGTTIAPQASRVKSLVVIGATALASIAATLAIMSAT